MEGREGEGREGLGQGGKRKTEGKGGMGKEGEKGEDGGIAPWLLGYRHPCVSSEQNANRVEYVLPVRIHLSVTQLYCVGLTYTNFTLYYITCRHLSFSRQ